MRQLLDLPDLSEHYGALFGRRGMLLMADRIARKGLPNGLYRSVRPLLWGAAPKAGKGNRRGEVEQVVGPVPYGDREWFVDRFPDAAQRKVAAAEAVCRHEFDFLGTGPRDWGESIDWHMDIKSGYRWPLRFWTEYGAALASGGGADVKVPWELSRLHHLVVLAQAWQLTRDAKYADEAIAQWESWQKANPWLLGVNWTSAMEAAVRAINLVWAGALLSDAPHWTEEREAMLTRSLREHGIFIEHNLEVSARGGLLEGGNHYLANVCGLACIGLARPGVREARRWRKAGLKALEQEARRQVLDDGVYFEPSTAYHRLAMELFLVPWLLARQTKREMSPEYRQRFERMLEVVLHLTRPDGCVPQVGDGDDGRLLILSGYPDWTRADYRYLLALGATLFGRGDFKAAAEECSEDVYWLLGRAGVEAFDQVAAPESPAGSRAFEKGGLYVIRGGNGYALVRAGTTPHHAPAAHAHNDALAVELWLDRKPVFVDRGTLCYASDVVERNRWRSTAAHNTVMVDGREQNRLSDSEPFKMTQEAQVRVVSWSQNEGGALLAAETWPHEKNQLVRHRRSVRYDAAARRFEVEDRLEGSGEHVAEWRWHAVPGCPVELLENQARVGEALMSWSADAPVEMRVEPARHARGYGDAVEANVLVGHVRWQGSVEMKTLVEVRGRASLIPSAGSHMVIARGG